MTHEELTRQIKTIVQLYKSLDSACDKAMDAGCMDPNGPLYDAVTRSFQEMLRMLDKNDWLAWFVYDNGCGEKGMKAEINGKLRRIRTAGDLARVMLS